MLFETGLEKLARVLSRQYHVEVHFQGNQAKTDGNRIVLPQFGQEIDEELKRDLNGYLDHEVAHIKFTDFTQKPKCKGRFHAQLLNMAEDVRINQLMKAEFPGSADFLDPLYEKLWQEVLKTWETRPWPIRFIFMVHGLLEGRVLPADAEVTARINLVKGEIAELGQCRSTAELRDVTARITTKLSQEEEKVEPPAGGQPTGNSQPNGDGTNQSSGKGGSKPKGKEKQQTSGTGQPPASNDAPSQNPETGGGSTPGNRTEAGNQAGSNHSPTAGGSAQDVELPSTGESDAEAPASTANPFVGDPQEDPGDSPSPSAEPTALNPEAGEPDFDFETSDPADPESDGAPSNSPAGSEQAESEDQADQTVPQSTPQEKALFHEPLNQPQSAFDEMPDSQQLVQRAIDAQIGKEVEQNRQAQEKREFHKIPFIPYPTGEDVITTIQSNHATRAEYRYLKKEVEQFVSPIVSRLERVLVAEETVRWRVDRDRGSINPRALTKVIANERQVFRDFTKGETRDVAVSLAIDVSGSMMDKRIKTARFAAISLAESLHRLGVACEITGFTTGARSAAVEARISRLDQSERARYNRLEPLELTIFKDFASNQLDGLVKVVAKNNTPLNDGIQWAARRLSLQPAARKILLVLTDGQPAVFGGDSRVLLHDCRVKIEACRKAGIEVVGLGIQTDYGKDIFPQYVLISKLEELPLKVMQELSKFLTVDPTQRAKPAKA